MSCAVHLIPVTQTDLSKFEAADASFPGKFSISADEVRALDGAPCKPKTRDGLLSAGGKDCHDIGVTMADSGRLLPGGLEWPLTWLPTTSATTRTPAAAAAAALAAKVQAALQQNQFVPSASGCRHDADEPWRSLYYVQTVPLVGFASVLEYLGMFLARAVHMRSQLLLGPRSSAGWTSAWFCGKDRSLRCYFNISSCSSVLTLHGRGVELPRRRNPLNIGLPGYNTYGSMWLSAQLAGFLFGQLNEHTRQALAQRRAALQPRASPPHAPRGSGHTHVPTIGMHIRGGDSCHARRFCPNNLTATFFAQAAELRRRYGVNRLLLATDNPRAAELCARRVLGFECLTMPMQRDKFESSTFIEKRVEAHEEGELSGAQVAIDALADLDMLADCDYFVLLFRSAMSRVAYSLSVARKGYHVPLVSMQWPWSPGYLKSNFAKLRGGKGQAMQRGKRRGRARGFAGRARSRFAKL